MTEAQRVGETLEAIRAQGKLNGQSIVDNARSAQSPLHEYFEWNDKIAGEKYRVNVQAPLLVRSVRIVIENGEATEHPAFMNVTHSGPSDGDGYEPVTPRLLANGAALNLALKELREWVVRWEDAPILETLWNTVHAELERTEAQLRRGKLKKAS